MNFNRVSGQRIAFKLPVIIVGAAIIAAAAVGGSSYLNGSRELSASATSKLAAVREARAAELGRYISPRSSMI